MVLFFVCPPTLVLVKSCCLPLASFPKINGVRTGLEKQIYLLSACSVFPLVFWMLLWLHSHNLQFLHPQQSWFDQQILLKNCAEIEETRWTFLRVKLDLEITVPHLWSLEPLDHRTSYLLPPSTFPSSYLLTSPTSSYSYQLCSYAVPKLKSVWYQYVHSVFE